MSKPGIRRTVRLQCKECGDWYTAYANVRQARRCPGCDEANSLNARNLRREQFSPSETSNHERWYRATGRGES